MISALARFVDALRAEGVVVSPAETLDAGRALDLVGLEEKRAVHAALKATLVKDRRAAEVFDRLFQRFFAPPVFPRREQRPGAGEGEPSNRRNQGGGIPPPDADRKPKAPDNATEGQSPRRRAEPGKGVKPPAPAPDKRRRDRALRNDRRQSEIPSRAQASRPKPGSARAEDPTHRILAARMSTDEERRIAHEVPRLIEALRLGLGRRLVRASSGRPWVRRALRESVATGGVPFTIPMRAPKPRRTRVVVLADVSFSTARAAGLFLWMAASFLKLGRNTRTLLFVDRPVDATEAIRRWAARAGAALPASQTAPSRRPRPGESIAPHGVSFADMIDTLPDLNPHAPSDYGTAFHALLTSPKRPRGRNTVLVILGDARTNRFDPLPWTLEELSRGCRAVIWLASEPRPKWGSEDSVLPLYLPWIDLVVEATDLAGLAHGLTELIRRL
ncbi:MAG TPA: VWA domain-containing protein [Terriglobia bacterium]|nr:VWA domain-containing protein [Terriglobia bacterium]